MFMSTGLSTLVLLRPQKEVPIGRDLLDHCSEWAELLSYQEDNMILG